MPVKAREWIRDNPRSTPLAQREDLFRAMEKGEIEGLRDKYLSAAHVHYWWRKGVSETTYISEDPWINVEHILKQHPSVFNLCLL